MPGVSEVLCGGCCLRGRAGGFETRPYVMVAPAVRIAATVRQPSAIRVTAGGCGSVKIPVYGI